MFVNFTHLHYELWENIEIAVPNHKYQTLSNTTYHERAFAVIRHPLVWSRAPSTPWDLRRLIMFGSGKL